MIIDSSLSCGSGSSKNFALPPTGIASDGPAWFAEAPKLLHILPVMADTHDALGPNINLENPLGSTTQAEGFLSMLKTQLARLAGAPACQLVELKEIRDESHDLVRLHLLGKFRFLSDLGSELQTMRQAAESTRVAHAQAANLSRGTTIAIETSQYGSIDSRRGRDGSSMGVLLKYLLPLERSVTLSLTPSAGDASKGFEFDLHPSLLASEASALLVGTLRKHASLTQGQLLELLQEQEPAVVDRPFVKLGTKSKRNRKSPWISRVESGYVENGVRLGTLFSIAFACGFQLAVVPYARKLH